MPALVLAEAPPRNEMPSEATSGDPFGLRTLASAPPSSWPTPPRRCRARSRLCSAAMASDTFNGLKISANKTPPLIAPPAPPSPDPPPPPADRAATDATTAPALAPPLLSAGAPAL